MKEEYKGYTIDIVQHEDAESPREWDNLGHMIYSHRNYALGDEEIDTDDFDNWEAIHNWLMKERKAVLVLPLRIYDHSGISMSTTTEYPYNDRWDSSMVGFIYTTKEDIQRFLTVKQLTKPILKQAQSLLVGEVKTYSQFLSGEVYGYTIQDEYKEDLSSCWGFYGYKACIKEAREQVDYYIEHTKPKARNKSILTRGKTT